MYPDIPLWLSIAFMAIGLAVVSWSSDVFVKGCATAARALGISPFIIGMVIVGFGTSAPELCVSTLSAISGYANLSLGNAYGSNIFNIAVILAVSALIFPVAVKSSDCLISGIGLAAISLLSWWLLCDGSCSRFDAAILIGVFIALLPPYCLHIQKCGGDGSCHCESCAGSKPWRPAAEIALGLLLLIGSSHLLVWGAIDFAKFMHVSDLVIGLTIVAAGTSLPELASAIAAARRREHELVFGNIIGSNFFNTLLVVGLAAFISPIVPNASGQRAFSPFILSRDLPLMTALSLSIAVLGVDWKRRGVYGGVKRGTAVVWLLVFLAYSLLIFFREIC